MASNPTPGAPGANPLSHHDPKPGADCASSSIHEVRGQAAARVLLQRLAASDNDAAQAQAFLDALRVAVAHAVAGDRDAYEAQAGGLIGALLPVLLTGLRAATPDSSAEALNRALRERIETASMAVGYCNDLATLFSTIKKLAEPDSEVEGLAKIGHYLGEDWGNSLDCERTEAEEALNAGQGGVL